MQSTVQTPMSVGSGSVISDTCPGGNRVPKSNVQQVLEILRKRQPLDSGISLVVCSFINIKDHLYYLNGGRGGEGENCSVQLGYLMEVFARFKPDGLSPSIKLQTLFLCFRTFLTEVVGRSC